MWFTNHCYAFLHFVHCCRCLCDAACPSAVSLEVSRDGVASLPVAAPKTTSGFTNINLELEKPEVVNAVTVRLHRPLDANSVGLSQIRLMGSAVFVDGGSGGGGGSSDEAVSSARYCLQQVHQHVCGTKSFCSAPISLFSVYECNYESMT